MHQMHSEAPIQTSLLIAVAEEGWYLKGAETERRGERRGREGKGKRRTQSVQKSSRREWREVEIDVKEMKTTTNTPMTVNDND